MPGQSEEWPEWATDALDKVREDRDVPFTDAQILKATSVTFEGGNDGRFLTGWGAKHAPEIEIDKDALGPPIGWVEGGHTDPTLPGTEPVTPENRFDDAYNAVVDTMLEKLHAEAESEAGDIEPPEYLADSAKEFQGEMWGQKEDSDKWDWLIHNTNIISDLEGEHEKQLTAPVPVTMPIHKATQALARVMSISRTIQVMKDRGLQANVDRMDRELWQGWKASSTGVIGQLLQLAIAEELGGRLNENQLKAGRHPPQRQGRVGQLRRSESYVRAKWEVTQWHLDKAEVSTVDLYRGVEHVYGPTVSSCYRLPDTTIRRNGAASWSIDRKVANDWVKVLRAQVPRTAMISVPAYGINVHSEREVVVAGGGMEGLGRVADAGTIAARHPDRRHQTAATP
jgi:hypothetical protein